MIDWDCSDIEGKSLVILWEAGIKKLYLHLWSLGGLFCFSFCQKLGDCLNLQQYVLVWRSGFQKTAVFQKREKITECLVLNWGSTPTPQTERILKGDLQGRSIFMEKLQVVKTVMEKVIK